jgi:type VI protein secretion system component Hcp
LGASLGAVACGGQGATTQASSELVGEAALAITNAPADGTCIQVTAVGNRTVTQSFNVPAGASSLLSLHGLPEGQVTFTAQAFAGPTCPPPADDAGVAALPTWVSEAPFTTTVGVRPPALVTLNLVRNGNAEVAVNFDDDAGLSPDAATSQGGSSSGGGGGAGSGTRIYLPLAGSTGGETQTPGFVGAYDVDELDVGLTVAVTSGTSGSGAGAGKPTWTVSAKLPTQTGVPDLYALAVTGKAVQTLEFSYVASGFSYLHVTLANATVTGVSAGPTVGPAPSELTVSFAATSLAFEFDTEDDDGGVGLATVAQFNLATNTASGPATTNLLDFAVGGPAPAGFEEATSFLAPSESSPHAFTPASVTYPLDVSALSEFGAGATGKAIPSGSVELFTTGSSTPYGTYGFTNSLVTSVSLAGTQVTVGFTSQTDSWTFGSDTVSFNSSTATLN